MRAEMFMVLACIVVLSIFAVSAPCADPRVFNNYSADMETTSTQGSFTSKIFFKDGKMRMEGGSPRQTSISITRPDKKVIWILDSGNKTYMEIPLDTSMRDIQSKLRDPNVKTEKEFISNEVVDKHPSKKYRLTIVANGKREKSGYIWEASDLNNFPVKYQSEDKKISTIWKNIRTGGVTDNVFELPPGYTKIDMSAIPAGGGEPRKQRK